MPGEVGAGDLVDVRVVLLHAVIQNDRDDRRITGGDVPCLGPVHIHIRCAAALSSVVKAPQAGEIGVVRDKAFPDRHDHVRLGELDLRPPHERVGQFENLEAVAQIAP